METGDVIGLLAIGFAAGMLGGMVGVGGGVLMVPGLVLFLDESQLRAEATSLLAVVLVASVGAWRQHRYGNVRVADGLLIGALAVVGAGTGAILANAVPERSLELGFAAVQLFFAWSLFRRATRPSQADSLTAQ